MAFLQTSSALPKHIKLPLSFKSISAKVPSSVILLQMCHNFREVRQLHAQFVVSGLLDHPLNFGRLLQSYVSMSQIADALSVFEAIPSPDVFACNTMIRGLIQGNCPYDALLVYHKLLLGGFTPDNHTYTFVLKACSHLKALSEGKQVQCQIIKAGIPSDTYVHSSLIHFYANSGSMDEAERVLAEFAEENTLALNCVISGYLSLGRVEKARAMFDNIARKDAATWSAMVTGYTKNKMHAEALTVFQDMIVSDARPNESVLVSSLSACANLGALDRGRWIHRYIDRTRIKMTTTVATAIIDMYSKCGSIEFGYQMFQEMPHRDVVAWGAIISGFAAHGHAWKCFELLDEMVADGIHPNEVVFVGILTACSHGGYVRKGQQYFHWMVHDFGIRPTIEHYGCMVDLLGRAGMLAEAYELIMSIPEEPNAVLWGSLLHACRIHNDLRRGYRAYKRLIELEPSSGDRYKLASLMFANAGEKEVAINIRKLIRKRELETLRGSSFIEVDGNVHEFLAGDINHQEMREIHSIW